MKQARAMKYTVAVVCRGRGCEEPKWLDVNIDRLCRRSRRSCEACFWVGVIDVAEKRRFAVVVGSYRVTGMQATRRTHQDHYHMRAISDGRSLCSAGTRYECKSRQGSFFVL